MVFMTPKEKKLYAVLKQVRTCFNQLKSLAEQMHHDLGVNPSMRAVLEHLSEFGAESVPEIARKKNVSRQHIQVIINALLEDELVEATDNPSHKRSLLYKLTKKGASTFSIIRKRELEPLKRLASSMRQESLKQADLVLQDLNQKIEAEILKGNHHE
jgi:DNA-binding MarR family transcriptional regulator